MSLKTIILSRFTKPKTDKETERKRKICKVCEYNSLNTQEISIKVKIISALSSFYSWITGKLEEDSLGNCNACGCSIFYKTLYEDKCGDKNKDRWKQIRNKQK